MKQHQPNTAAPEAAQGSVMTYTIGFLLSVIFTLFAYFLVVDYSISTNVLTAAIVVLAVVQMFIQLIFFLHLGQESRPRWNLIVLLFALLVVLIVVAGSIWIMNNLDTHMMTPAATNSYIIQDERIPQ